MADNETAKTTPWGAVVRYIRVDLLKMTRPEFADLAGVSDVSIYKWETGRIEEPASSSVVDLHQSLTEHGLGWITLADLMSPDAAGLRDRAKDARREAERSAILSVALGRLPADLPVRDRVLQLLLGMGSTGLTDEEIADALEVKASTVARRRRELANTGLVEELGERDNSPVWGAA